jgi:ubiquitin C-terminal hydrolase
MGNTCYLNATLQAVIHSHGFVDQLYKARSNSGGTRSANALTNDILEMMT